MYFVYACVLYTHKHREIHLTFFIILPAEHIHPKVEKRHSKYVKSGPERNEKKNQGKSLKLEMLLKLFLLLSVKTLYLTYFSSRIFNFLNRYVFWRRFRIRAT